MGISLFGAFNEGSDNFVFILDTGEKTPGESLTYLKYKKKIILKITIILSYTPHKYMF